MNSTELYKEAYDLQYKDGDYEGALETYKKLQLLYPDSEEAIWAKSQIENINKDLAMKQRKTKFDERSVENNLTIRKEKDFAIKLILSKNQSKGMTGKINFSVYARAEMSEDATNLIRHYKLQNEILFQKKMVNIWGQSTEHLIDVRVKHLLNGQSYSCKSLDEVISYSDSVKSACKVLISYLKVASSFGGKEIIEIG